MVSEQLVGASELLRHSDDPRWRIIDCRFDLADAKAGRQGYLQSHIPNAVFADLNDDLAGTPTSKTGRHPLPTVAELTQSFTRMGVGSDTRVVVYDSGNGAMAARCWWLLRWLGHENAGLLDGGFDHWTALDMPVESGEQIVANSEFVARPRYELLMTTAELVSAANDISQLNLLDARDAARFRGEVEPIDAIAGHVPGTRNQPFTASLTDEGRWKSIAELQALWAAQLGTDRNVAWAVMCGSGVTACHLAISGILAGYNEPRLYVGSWSEWIRDPTRPIGVGKD